MNTLADPVHAVRMLFTGKPVSSERVFTDERVTRQIVLWDARQSISWEDDTMEEASRLFVRARKHKKFLISKPTGS